MFSKKYKDATDNALYMRLFKQEILNAFLKSKQLTEVDIIDEVLYSVLEKMT